MKNLEIIAEKLSFELENYLTDQGIGARYRNSDLEKCRIKDKIDKFFKKKELGKGMLILGPVGTGKTSALVCIVKKYFELHQGRHNIVFTSANKIFSAFFQKDTEFLNRCRTWRILMIDDFGREYQHEFPFSEFEDLIEYRYANMLSTFITSNLTAQELSNEEKYRRIVDRWRECCEIIQIGGKSMRGK